MNLEWEQTRFLATMIHNVNCSKKQQMIKPENLFPLPQDNRVKKSKSTKEQYERFLKKVNNIKKDE
jgi:hypothetical protein